jgi:magnesium transporter
MKPTLLHRVVAPSPSVLSFLRAQVNNALERPVPQCAYVTGQQRGYGTNSKTRWSLENSISREKTYSPQRRGGSESRTFTTSPCLLEQNTSHPILETSLAIRHTPKTSLQRANLPTYRAFSATRSHNAWNMFSSAKMRRLAQLQSPAPPPEETSPGATGFGSSLGRMMRPTNELKMRCTELDEHGNVTLVSGEFKKSELIAKVRFLAGWIYAVDFRLRTGHSTVSSLATSARSIPPSYHTFSSDHPLSS